MKYCWRNMKWLRHEVSFGHEVKFAHHVHQHTSYTAGVLHMQGILHLPEGQISMKKALAFASAFFWWGRTDSFAFSFPCGE